MANTEFHMHHDSPEKVGRRERLGVRILIVADASFLFAMVFSWFYLRNLNANDAWLPKGVKTFGAATSWIAIAPYIVSFLFHRIAMRDKAMRGPLMTLAFAVLVIGAVYQWHQISHMPFVAQDDNGRPYYNGAYASNWILFAGSNMFHYILTGFIALGLAIRGFRGNLLDAVLEDWRQKVAGSWFTWVAIGGVISAITMSFK
jgi:hypothetical protein